MPLDDSVAVQSFTSAVHPLALHLRADERLAPLRPPTRADPDASRRASIVRPPGRRCVLLLSFPTLRRYMSPLAWKAGRSFRSISRVLTQHDARERIPALRRSFHGRALPQRAPRNRSPTPPIPPRRPTTRQFPSPRRAAWTPRRAEPAALVGSQSRARAGRPVAARKPRTAPCGGARSSGNRGGLARGCRSRAPKATSLAGQPESRTSVLVAGPVTWTRAASPGGAPRRGSLDRERRLESVPAQRPTRASAAGRHGRSPEITRHEGARERRDRRQCRGRERRPQPHGERDSRARRP